MYYEALFFHILIIHPFPKYDSFWFLCLMAYMSSGLFDTKAIIIE